MVVAVGGAYGTLSEIALALKAGTPVVGLRTWAIDGVQSVASAHEAVRLALSLAGDGAARNLSEGVERPPSGDVPFD